MPIFIWFAAMAVAVAIPLAWWSVSGDRATRAGVRANLEAIRPASTNARVALLEQPAHERVTQPLVSSLAQRARRITPAGMIDGIAHRIALAGLTETMTVDRMLAMKFAGLVGGGLVGLFFFGAKPSTTTFVLLGLIVAIGWFGPDVILTRRAEERQREIERSLADALDQITVCVESGLSFEGAVARVAAGSGPLAAELLRVLQDIQLGMPRGRALQNMLERTDVADVRSFVHSFMHAERYGVPIAQVLRAQSSEMRDKRKQRAEERAAKIPVKLVFPLTLCILPALFVVVAGPAVVRISHAFGI